MKKLLALLFLLPCFAFGAVNTYTLSVTNFPLGAGATNIVVNSVTRWWTNATSSSTIQTNLVSTNGVATNLFRAYGSYGQAGVLVRMSGVNQLVFRGLDLTVSSSDGWCAILTNSSPTTNTWAVTVPPENLASTNQTTNANYIVDYLDLANKSVKTNSTSLANYLTKGACPTQTVTAPVRLDLIARGTNAGTIYGGNYDGATAVNLTVTNLSAPGAGAASQVLGASAAAIGANATAIGAEASATNAAATALGYQALAEGINGTALGTIAQANGLNSTAIGQAALATGDYSTALGDNATATALMSGAFGRGSSGIHENSTAVGYSATSTASNQIVLGTSSQHILVPGRIESPTLTNAIPKGTTFFNGLQRYSVQTVTSLANGNNTMPTLTAYLVEITTGPTAAFTIASIPAGASGEVHRIVNLNGNDMTFAHESGFDATAVNRGLTMTGADVASTGNGIAEIYYSASQSRWILTYLTP